MSDRMQKALRSCILTRDFGEDWWMDESDAAEILEEVPDYQAGGLQPMHPQSHQRKRDYKAEVKARQQRREETVNDQESVTESVSSD